MSIQLGNDISLTVAEAVDSTVMVKPLTELLGGAPEGLICLASDGFWDHWTFEDAMEELCLGHVKGKGAIGDFLAMRFREYAGGEENVMGWTKQIWDMAAVAWVIDDSWIPTVLEATPLLTNDYTWSFDGGRHLNRTSTAAMNRDGIMRDFFVKLDAFAKQPGTAPSSKL